MATLLKVETGDGHRRLCSAKCYTAHGERCTCICGGMNHGVGAQQAAQNTQALPQEWVAQIRNKVNRSEALRLQAQADQLTLQLY